MTTPPASIDLDNFASLLSRPEPGSRWRPVPVDSPPADRERLDALAREHRFQLVDQLVRQLRELAQVRFPAEADAAERTAFLDRAQAGGGYPGTWVWYPWESKLIRLLDRDDYFDVITSRNHDKITRDEQRRLREKTVGVVGLSVGGEIAVTVAQEHLCGRIVLADFDTLDLSNLNRLGAGVDELGENKACIIARRIARIDPYLEIEILPEGVTDANAEAFLSGLDLLIEECDDLVMKYRLREMAASRGLDLVYAADEGGLISLEPYSRHTLEPFHGRIAEPPRPRDTHLDILAFMKSLTEWLGGWERISARSRESVEALGRRTCGYPQLAGEPRYAAGQVAYLARQTLLGAPMEPILARHDLAALFAGSVGSLLQSRSDLRAEP